MITLEAINTHENNNLEKFADLYSHYEALANGVLEKIKPILEDVASYPSIKNNIKIDLYHKFLDDSIYTDEQSGKKIKKPKTAFATILKNGSYEIYIALKFTRLLFIYADLIKEKYALFLK